jgi:hypothetical protein
MLHPTCALDRNQAYSQETNPSLRQTGCYTRTTSVKIAVKNTMIVLEGLDAKTNRLAVNGRSQNNSAWSICVTLVAYQQTSRSDYDSCTT